MVFTSLIAAALALPGWTEAGPERGHVVDAAVGPDAVLVATRVGVLRASPQLDGWARDPRFPPETKVLAMGADGVAWAAPAGSIWRVDASGEPVARLGASAAVDLAVTGEGALLAAVRGADPHVLRIGDASTKASTKALEGVDPWRVMAEGERAWVATVDQGVWASTDGGRSFTQLRGGAASALGLVDGRALAAFSDGQLIDLSSGDTLLQLDGAWVSAIADADGLPLLVIESMGGRTPPLALLKDGALVDLPLFQLDADDGFVRPTGAWTLPDGQALVGTFRRGPLRLDDGALRLAREGFRAGVTGGVAGAPDGRVLWAAMGTGAYLSDDAVTWTPQHGRTGPVTDAVGVAFTGQSSGVSGSGGSAFAVTDFEGVASLKGETWSRIEGVDVPGVPRRSGLSMASVDAEGRWWALDDKGGLWLREGEGWTRCKERGDRLEGQGADLVLASGRGFLGLSDCAATATLRWPEVKLSGDGARSEQGWVAGAGGLWRDGVQVTALPPGKVQALAAKGDRALVAMDDGVVLACGADGCAPAAERLPVPIAGVGWLADGRVWAAESKGTILIAEGEGALTPWSTAPALSTPPFESHRLYTAPWGTEGKAGGGPPGMGPPGQPGMGPPGQPGMGPPPGHPGPSAEAPPAEEEAACGCAGAPRGAGLWAWALLALALGARRRGR